MPLLNSLADVRDVFIIIYGFMGILFFCAALILTIIVAFGVRDAKRKVSSLLDDSIKPTIESFRDTAEAVRGTTEFIGRTAVAPIVRTYGAFAGVRRGLGVLSTLTRRGRGG